VGHLADDFLGQLIAPGLMVVLTLTLVFTMPVDVGKGKHHSVISALNMAARQLMVG
jgi:hypothetical protein